jgi:hypothetical protein
MEFFCVDFFFPKKSENFSSEISPNIFSYLINAKEITDHNGHITTLNGADDNGHITTTLLNGHTYKK